MDAELASLLDEWLTGRDAKGAESQRFSRGWSTGARGLLRNQRIYRPHIGSLAADIRRRSTAYAVRTEIVAGIDGDDELRIVEVSGSVRPAELREEMAMLHTETPHLVTVSDPRTITPDQMATESIQRWRPSSGGLSHVIEAHGSPRGDRAKPAAILAAAASIDEKTASSDARDDLASKATILRAARAHLREVAQAHADAKSDPSPVASKLASIDAKLATINAEKDRRKAAVRAARIEFAKQRAAIWEKDPDAKVELLDGKAVKVDRKGSRA